MNKNDRKKWLNRNGVLELFDYASPPGVPIGLGTTGMWIGYGKLTLTSCSRDPISDLYGKIKDMLWYEIDTAYLDE